MINKSAELKSNRNSAFELLRIIMMLGIVFSHFAFGKNFNFPVMSITLNKLWIQFLIMGGKLGVNTFVLISGYFLIYSDGLKIKRILGIWSKMIFYSLAMFIMSIYLGFIKFSVTGAINAFLPVIKGRWWFASTYFMLYLIHPYINLLIKNLTKRQYEEMLILLTICWVIVPTLTNSFLGCNGLLWFAYLYSIAGYIRLHADNFGSTKFIWLAVLLIILNFLLAVVFDLIGLKMNIKIFAEHPLHFFNTQMLPTVLIPVCLLIGFSHLDLGYCPVINIIASATFAVYMIHTEGVLYVILWRDIVRTLSFQDSNYLIPYSLGVVLLIYISCTLIELARSKVFKIISGGRLS